MYIKLPQKASILKENQSGYDRNHYLDDKKEIGKRKLAGFKPKLSHNESSALPRCYNHYHPKHLLKYFATSGLFKNNIKTIFQRKVKPVAGVFESGKTPVSLRTFLVGVV